MPTKQEGISLSVSSFALGNFSTFISCLLLFGILFNDNKIAMSKEPVL